MDANQDDTQMPSIPGSAEEQWLGERLSQACKLRDEIGRVCNVPGIIEIPETWMRETVLELTVPNDHWEDFKTAFNSTSRATSEKIQDVWTEKNAICVRIGLDIWNSERADREKGSPKWDIEFGDPLNCDKRLQTVKLVSRQHSSGVLCRCTEELELMAIFLRSSLRLDHSDITIAVQLLADHDVEWQFLRGPGILAELKTATEGYSTKTALMLTSAIGALMHAVREDYVHRLPEAFLDPEKLKLLRKNKDTSAANRLTQVSWTVIAHVRGRNAAEALRKLGRSFFIDWPNEHDCHPQVHIIDDPIQSLRHPFLIQFRGLEPTAEAVKNAVNHLGEVLGIDVTGAVISCAFLDKKITRKCFRPDGDEETFFRDAVLSLHLREALNEELEEGEARPVEGIPELLVLGRQAYNIIIWGRQSSEEGGPKAGSLPRQLTTVIKYLIGQVIPKDEIRIYSEHCSSSKHPLRDRQIWSHLNILDEEKPTLILTVNPDRLTRRAEEVDLVRSRLRELKGAWYVLGASLDDDFDDEHWHKVEGDVAESIKTRLRLGREIAYWAGMSNRISQQMIRVSNYLDKVGDIPKQVADMSKVLNLAIKSHGFTSILKLTRVAASWTSIEQDSLKKSLVKQMKFLDCILRYCNIPTEHLKASDLSAYHDGFVDHLEESLEDRGGGILIVVTSLDRACMSTHQWSRLQNLLKKGRHGLLCFLWDTETNLDPREALQLDIALNEHAALKDWRKSLEAQKRAPMLSLNWPLVQPILCINGRHQQDSDPTMVHSERHVENAQRGQGARSMTRYQGESHIETVLQKLNGIDATISDQSSVAEWVAKELNHPQEHVKVVLYNGSSGYHCHCEQDVKKKNKTHDDACQCRCAFCNDQRSCPCVVDHHYAKKCECPVLCNCHCKGCHEVPKPSKKRDRPEIEPESEPESEAEEHPSKKATKCCEKEGCNNIVSKVGKRFCDTCDSKEKMRRCHVEGCTGWPFVPAARACKVHQNDPKTMDPSPDLHRICLAKYCTAKAPISGKGGKYCLFHKNPKKRLKN